MATTVGLSTHIWNNNLRCIVLLCLYPVLILGLVWIMGYVFASMQGGYNMQRIEQDTGTLWLNRGNPEYVANNIVYAYWPTILGAVSIWFVIAWFFHTSMIRRLSHSHPVSRQDEPELYNLLENLCISQGIKMPRLEIIETHARNAFASGISNETYSITVTRGLMNSLRPDEMEAVLGHELTHILNRDVRLLIITVIFTGMFGFLAQLAWSNIRYSLFYSRRNRENSGGTTIAVFIIAILLWLGYLATLLMRFALSRRREYMADAGAVSMTKNPDAMMRALMRIAGRDRIPETTDDIAMMCIENHVPFLGVFATHPPINERIKAISQVTGTPIPNSSHLAPAKSEERFSSPAREGNRPNPWLIRQRRD